MARAMLVALLVLLAPSFAQAQSCPAPLGGARKLVLVTADTLSTATASLQTFIRANAASPWRATTGPATALIGSNGVGWAQAFRQFAAPGEPIKIEGDKRVPAGFFKIGRPFGFAPSAQPHYLQITEGITCVDDPASAAYNTIATRAKIGPLVHGENMWRFRQYRSGLLVDYPTDRAARAGSCIFIHRWLKGATSTHGCVALPEQQLQSLQNFSLSGAVLAVLPRQALDRFTGCLPN